MSPFLLLPMPVTLVFVLSSSTATAAGGSSNDPPSDIPEMPMTWVMKTEVTETETITETTPSRKLLISGLSTFGSAYLTAFAVAASSPREADRRMYAPIVGPFIALEGRGDCGPAVDRPCTRENAYRVLIVIDGLMQVGGALATGAAFLYPDTVTITRQILPGTARVRVLPSPLGTGYGLLAQGCF